ncbi:FbpB family small basic protein [Virgibacillus sp. W0181]|uniref:FbpB family small basic protein n=1 Tax=Virgibacillus sp. W0181 TaxID=3391581 RepID=UPI003F446AFB
MGNTSIKGVIAISLKKRITFDDLVAENRQNILENQIFMERIERTVEDKLHESYKNSTDQQVKQ